MTTGALDLLGALTHADGNPVTVLIVDEQQVLAEMLAMILRLEGAVVTTAGDAATAMKAGRRGQLDMLIIDPDLPDSDGARLLRWLRERQPTMRVLLTDCPRRIDRDAVWAGGGHRLPKPFSLEDVLGYVRLLLRCSEIGSEYDTGRLQVGDLVLDEDSRAVWCAGLAVALTETEFALLRFLVRNAGRVVSRAEILARVWPYDFAGGSAVVPRYISRLRNRLASHRGPVIHTIRGSGYLLDRC